MIAPDAFTCLMSELRPEYPLTPNYTNLSLTLRWKSYRCMCVHSLTPDTHKRVGTSLTAPSPIGPSLSMTTMQINTMRTSQSAQMALLERMCRGIICHLPRILGHGKGISKARAISAKPVCNPARGGKRRHTLWRPVHVFTPPTCDCDPEFNKTVRKCLSAYLTIIGMT